MRGIDDHDDRERRLARRHEPDERRVVVRLRVAPVDQLRRRPGLPGNGVSLDLRKLRRGPPLDDRFHDFGQRRRGLRGDRAPQDPGRDRVAAAVAQKRAHDARLDEVAAVGDRAHGGRHLQRRDADLVSHRDRCEGARIQPLRVPDDAGVLAAEVRRERLAEAEPGDVAAEALGAEPHPHPDRPDVARLRDDVDERQRAVRVHVADDPIAEHDEPGRAVDLIGRRDHPLFDRRRRGDDFERGSRLVQILDGAVAPRGDVGRVEDIRVERRPVRQREDLAGVRLHDDGGAAGGRVLFDADAQLAIRDVLQVLVDGELEPVAGRRRALLARRHGVPARVGLEQHLAFAAADARVERGFEPGQTLVHADVAEHVRRELFLRVVPPAFLEEQDAPKVERPDAARLLGRHPAREIRELALAAQPVRHQRLLRRLAVVELVAHELCDRIRIVDVRGIGGDRIGVHAVGQDAPRAIDDLPALGRENDRLQLLPVRARHHLVVPQHLQIQQAGLDPDGPGGEERRADQQARADGAAPVGRRGRRLAPQDPLRERARGKLESAALLVRHRCS